MRKRPNKDEYIKPQHRDVEKLRERYVELLRKQVTHGDEKLHKASVTVVDFMMQQHTAHLWRVGGKMLVNGLDGYEQFIAMLMKRGDDAEL